MTTMTMSGDFRRQCLPFRSIREAARQAVDPYAEIVSTGNIRAWDLFALRGSAIPGASQWANRTLDTIVASAVERFQGQLDCPDCQDVGFYGLVSREDPDILTSLLRRVDNGGYEVLTASAGWQDYEIVADQQLEILSRELAGDLAEAVTSGASGLVRRYFWPAAFLPPDAVIAAGPAKELTDPNVAVDTQDALDAETAAQQGWVTYAVVDDLDPGAVLDVIRLRRGPTGPELLAYRNGVWAEAPDVLSDLQGVQPPPLVELSADQLSNVLQQVDAGGPADSGGDGTDQTDAEGAQAVAAALGLTAAGPSQAERDKAAQKGQALPEGGFPIKNTDDLKKAVRALGRATNPTAAKRHIIKRARELKATGLLPDSWGITAAGFPETQTCKFGDEPAEYRMLWAEGMAYIPVCEDHLDTGRQVIEDDNNDEVVKILVIPAPEEDEEDEDEEALEAAFMPSRVPSGRPGGGQFAPKDASEQATADAEKKQADAEHQQAIQDAKDAAAQRLKNEEAIRQQKQAENRRRATQQEKDALRTEERNKREREREADRARRLREHEADRARRLAEHKQDRARMLRERATRAHQKATASRHRAKSTARKGSTAAKATYGTGNVVGYDQRTGTIHYADGSSFDGSTWKTKYGKRITASGALLADAPLTVSPDPRAEKLRRYWSEGKGALKIRWGTPGDWTRCYRQLSKYMGLRAKGYCQNLHKRSTGVWTGSRLNPGGHRGRRGALAASGTSGALSMEVALVAAMSTGRWFGPEGGSAMVLKDGVYVEGGDNTALLKTLTAGGFPVAPPDEWFENPQLDAPTPLSVDDNGRVYGHIATRDVAHIGLPGKVRAPQSRSNYAYFKTGQLVTASGRKVNVGQLTLAGGHAPLNADASAAVAHYDNTASAVADLNCGDDKWGIWVAGALRPEVTPSQLRTLRASAPSGDWRPINGHLEMVACCQVNVPGFPVVRARVASGAITSLVAAGSGPLYARRLALMADATMAERVAALESTVFAQLSEGLEDPSEVLTADAETETAEGEPLSDEQAAEEGLVDTSEEKPVSEAVQRAREAVRARRAAQGEQPPAEQVPVDDEQARAERLAALRERVHGTKEPVPAGA
jgi:hypothetical protein